MLQCLRMQQKQDCAMCYGINGYCIATYTSYIVEGACTSPIYCKTDAFCAISEGSPL